jgi:hypothetical protein
MPDEYFAGASERALLKAFGQGKNGSLRGAF